MSKLKILRSSKHHLLRTENRRTCCDRITVDLCNDENWPSPSSSAVIDVQVASRKNTRDEMADAITGGNDIGLRALWPANIPEKCGKIGWNMKQLLFDIVIKSNFWNMIFHKTKKAETSHGNVPQVLFVARTTMAK